MHLFSKYIPRGLDNWCICIWLKEITLLEAENPPEPIAHLPWSKIKRSSANSSFPKTKHLLKVTHLRGKHVVTDNLSTAPLRTPSGPNPCTYTPLLRPPALPGEDWKPHISPRIHPATDMFTEIARSTIYPTSSLLVFFVPIIQFMSILKNQFTKEPTL